MTLSEKINYHKNMNNPPLDSIPTQDVKEFIKELKELNWIGQKKLNKEIDKLAGEELVE